MNKKIHPPKLNARVKKHRCPKCGGMVVMPCYACDLKEFIDTYGKIPEKIAENGEKNTNKDPESDIQSPS